MSNKIDAIENNQQEFAYGMLNPIRKLRLWTYAALVSRTDPNTDITSWYIKYGDTRAETLEQAQEYIAKETLGKIRGVFNEQDIIGIWDMTEHAISNFGKDPNEDIDKSRGYDDDIRDLMPFKRKYYKNFFGSGSLELHPIPLDFRVKCGNDWVAVLKTMWNDTHVNLQNGIDTFKKADYHARNYCIESFEKVSRPDSTKHLLAAATGAGKETSTLALIIFTHDIKGYGHTTIHACCPTIPSTGSELLNELGTVAGMHVGKFGYMNYSRIKAYITEQWFDSYYKDCSPRAKMYINDHATVVKTVSDIPRVHDKDCVPVLFGSYHDLALKSDESKISIRYKGLEKRIGILAIGEAHQMLSNADNKMWKNLNKAFGSKCFKLFITGTPYDFIYSMAAAEFFNKDERSLFTRNDLYKDKRTNPNSDYIEYPDFNYYGINVKDVVNQLKLDYRWEGDDNGFTFNKLFTYNPREKQFVYEKTILWLFKRMFSTDAFSESGDPLSIHNAPELCEVAKQHGMVALPVGNSDASAKVYIGALKKLLIDNGVFQGDVFDAYDDDLGDRKDDITNAKGMTLTLTCNKDCTGANIPELGYFVFMRKLGDSVKFFEQATGRVGRKFPGKDNCGVFLADLENSMNIMLTIEEKINADRGEDFSVREMIEELLDNYNFFTGRNGKWEAINPIDFASTLEELNAKGNYGIIQCLRNTDPDTGFDLFFADKVTRESKSIEINSNNNKGAKNINRMVEMEQLGLPFDKSKSFKKNWINAKLTFVSKCRWLAFLHNATTVKQCVNIIETALLNDDKETLEIIGKGVEWFPIIMTETHIDIHYTDRWIQKFNDNKDNFESLLEMLADPIHKTDTFVAEPNRKLRRYANKLLRSLNKKTNLSFIDVCGGRGGFLIYIIHQANELGIDVNPKNIYYNDIDKNMTTFFKKVNKEYNLKIPEENITSEDFLTKEYDMKFSAGIINPPYEGKARTHQKFFNKIYDLLEDDGVMAVLQPATTYFNKKDTHLSEPTIETMVEIIKGNTCETEIENPEIFDNAGIQNDLSVTYIIKDNNNTGVVDKITYKDGNKYENVPLADISQTVIDPVIYASIKNKYQTYCKNNGNLEDVIVKDKSKLKADLPKIRGTRPTDDDFYTFIPKVEKDFLNYYNGGASDFGVSINKNNEKDNVYDYLRSYVARFGLALLKFSQNTANKEFALVPLVDFTSTYKDSELFSLLKLTSDEINVIKKVICNYYDR